MGFEKKEAKHLTANKMAALRDLHINPTHKMHRDETPFFLLYLNFAVNNICDITGISKDVNTPKSAADDICKKGKDTIRKLANFLWLFNVDDPGRDFPDYENKTLEIVKKIYELRNYFSHLDRKELDPMIVDRDFYVFVGGVLHDEALNHAIQPGLRTAKLFKMKLFATHNKEKQLFEFTRRGLVFLICLALYKGDAMEFTQCLEDMKLPVCPKGRDPQETCGECENFAACTPAVAKAFISMFTHFSARRGRSINLLEDDLNYMSFADITGYLNKVPADSWDYLTLDAETARLQTLKEMSTESEENKEFKYALHKRFGNRFLSFAAAFCEDHEVLPALRFKRLDISDSVGRKRYFFGKEHDNRVHMDRHYQIDHDAIKFAFVPQEHYGDIHIDSLRSSISASTMKELLFANFSGINPSKAVNDYFKIYHRLLETIINTNFDDLYLENLTVNQKQHQVSILDDFATISGIDKKSLEEDLTPLYRFFPQNLIRYFTDDENMPSEADLKTALQKKLNAMRDHAEDFRVRMKTFQNWKNQLNTLRDKDPEARLPKPVCSAEDVKNPPRSCEISDATLIAWVFRYFNLFLENDKKFRQLPLGEQHREGVTDHEYQLVHALIGKYTLDPKALKNYIEHQRRELLPALNNMNPLVFQMQKDSTSRHAPVYSKTGKPIRDRATLSMLALAAATCYRDFCQKKLNILTEESVSGERLKAMCRKFGIRTGMPKDQLSLYKTALKIDLAKWMNAYDAETKQNFENRSLSDSGHIVSQIPFPVDFAQRIMLNSKNPKLQQFIRTQNGKAPCFDFNAAFRAMTTEIAPRDFYDVSPILTAFFQVKNGKKVTAVTGLRTTPRENEFPADFSRNALNKALVSIKNVCNQDKILLKIALNYWNKFQSSGAFICQGKKTQNTALAETPSVYDYFSASVLIRFPGSDDRLIRIMPNDINRPILSQIREYAPVIAKRMSPDGSQKEFEFYEMLKVYRVIQAEDRRKRIEIIPYIQKIAEAVTIPSEKYQGLPKNDQTAARKMEFPYYQKRFSDLTFEQYNAIVEVRNAVYHRGLDLDTQEVLKILKTLK